MQFYTNVEQWGKNLLVREIVDGQEERRKIKYAPSLFVPSNKGDYKGFFGESLSRIDFNDMKEAKEFYKNYEDVENFEIHGLQKFPISWIQEEYPNAIDYDSNYIRTFIIDIETYISGGVPNAEDAFDPITAITLWDSYKNMFIVFGTGDYQKHKDNVLYVKCENEAKLLHQFLYYWTLNYPHIVVGWNSSAFDIPYIGNRIFLVLGEKAFKSLSPWGIIKDKYVYAFGEKIISYNFVGISEIDYLSLYKKYVLKPRESYSLDHIAYAEGLGQKIDYSEVAGLNELYETNHQKFIEYNIHDVDLVKQLDEKIKLLDLTYEMSYYAKVNFEDSLSPVKTWDSICCDYLWKQNIVPPPNKKGHKLQAYEGAYVKEPKTGFSNWVISVDLNSLYPHIMQQANLGRETMVMPEEHGQDLSWVNVESLLHRERDLSWLKDHNWTLTPNGQLFRTDKKSIFNILMEIIYKTRNENKNKGKELEKIEESGNGYEGIENDIAMYDIKQNGQKVLMNALYGASGNEYFRLYSLPIASAITTYGQLVIRWAQERLDEFMNEWMGTKGKKYVIYCDTDSAYIELDEVVRANFDDPWYDVNETVNWLDKFVSEVIEPQIEKIYQDLADYLNAYAQKMGMKREILADRAVWTSKKHYIMNVYDDEGVRYNPPKLKIMGMEAIKSTHPEIVRKKLKEAYGIILNDNEETLIQLVKDFKDEFYSLSPEDIAFPRGVNEIKKWVDDNMGYKSGTPQHVKAAINFNKELKKNNLQEKYSPIFESDKMKFVFLNKANPTIANVIGFSTYLPRELNLLDYINYDLQWQKTFIEPLNGVLKMIGWDYEKRASLNDFFN